MPPRAVVFLLLAGCATAPAVERVTPAPPTVVVQDEPKAAEPEKKPIAEEQRAKAAPISGEEGQSGALLPPGIDAGEPGTGGTIRMGASGSPVGVGSAILGGARGSASVSPDEENMRVIRRDIRTIRECYSRELANQPNLEGRLIVVFVIAPDGHVTESNAVTSIDPNVDACILAVFKRMTFPKPKGGRSATVRFPLTFTQAK